MTVIHYFYWLYVDTIVLLPVLTDIFDFAHMAQIMYHHRPCEVACSLPSTLSVSWIPTQTVQAGSIVCEVFLYCFQAPFEKKEFCLVLQSHKMIAGALLYARCSLNLKHLNSKTTATHSFIKQIHHHYPWKWRTKQWNQRVCPVQLLLSTVLRWGPLDPKCLTCKFFFWWAEETGVPKGNPCGLTQDSLAVMQHCFAPCRSGSVCTVWVRQCQIQLQTKCSEQLMVVLEYPKVIHSCTSPGGWTSDALSEFAICVRAPLGPITEV